MHRRSRNRALAALVAVALVPLGLGLLGRSAGAATTNLITNAGFETGTLSGWSCDAGTASVVTSPVHSGTHALSALPTGSADAQCTQTVAVLPNSTYTLSAYVEGPYVYLGANGGSSTWTPSATSWQQLSTTFTTGASTTSITVYLHGWYGQGSYQADDVVLTGPGGGSTPTPTPSASTSASASATPTATPTPTPTPTSTGGTGGTAAWHPNYLSIGSVYTPGSTVDAFFTTLKSHGKLPNYGYEYLIGGDFANWAATTTTMVTHSEQFGMTPVLVDYGMNGNIDGTSVDYTNMQSASWLTTYFQSLKSAAQAAQAAAPGKPVGWVIEPDMLGYLQQNYAAQYNNDAAQFPAATNAAYSSGVLASGTDPAFGNNLKGLVQAINYAVKKYDPTAFVGWQINTWGVRDALKDTDTLGWTAGQQSVVTNATQVANFAKTAGITYDADFAAFDQWGQDFGVLNDPNPAGDIRYLNAAHWSNYLLYAKTIRQSLGLPAVLWQLPTGHLNSTLTASPTYWNASGKFPNLDDVSANRDEDSAATFFYGDSFTSSGNNLAFYSSNPGADPKVTVSGSTVTWGSHLPEAAADGVVAILFGAGTGSGTYGVPEMVGSYQSAPSDYDYWVTRTQSYLAAPTPLP
ncbi:carbohydrate binding protein [Streptomyces sp. 846.5]|nr:carbohydrate binding domain-containing protein [Streptomyces sp. 846.5]TDT95550.1 carbohydrate binding protein [Streptomyces sp. 846.5]